MFSLQQALTIGPFAFPGISQATPWASRFVLNSSGWNIKTSRTLLISGGKSSSPPGTVIFRFQQKLKAIKAKIHTWNREEFGNIFEDKKRLLCELDLINRKGTK